MKQQLFSILSVLFLSISVQAQVFWTEDFGAGACNQGQLATAYAGANGAWTVTDPGANGIIANDWYISATEQGGVGDSGCGIGCGGTENNTLHLGNAAIALGGILADLGAAYGESGGVAGFEAHTDTRAESPTIDCTGQADITIEFLYMEGLTGQDLDPIDDNAELWYFDGATWALLDDPTKTATTCAPQGTWTAYSITLPASADNNPNVKIGFHWINDDDGDASDPSFAVDDITLSTPDSNAPIALFGALPGEICAGDFISIIDNQSSGGVGVLTSSWSFGGGLADLTDPSNPANVTWDTPGTYTISLTVTDDDGAVSEPYDFDIIIADCSPISDLTITPNTICMGDSISFTNNSTFEGPPPSVTWAWDFGNGNTSADQNPAGEIYLDAGTFTVQLIMTDDYGIDSTEVEVTVANCAIPNAFFAVTDSTQVCENTDITFTDSSIPSSGETITSWEWNFGINANPTTFTGQNPGVVSFTTAGTYNVSLIIIDPNGSDTSFMNIEVIECSATTVDIIVTEADSIICLNDCLTFESNTNSVSVSNYSWTFENGTPATSDLQNPGQVCFNNAGQNLNVILNITDDNGITSDTMLIIVNSLPLIETNASSTSICIGQTVTLTATGGGPNNTIVWDNDVLDGIAFTPEIGAQVFTATLTDNNTNCSNTDDITVLVNNCTAPDVQIALSSNTTCLTECIGFESFSSNADSLFWDFGPSATPSTFVGAAPGEVCFNAVGTFTVTLIAINDFDNFVTTVEITVFEPPTVTVPTDTYEVDFGFGVTITANSPDDVTYSWAPPQTLENPFSQSPLATPDEETMYLITVEDPTTHCTAVDTVVVSVNYTLGLGIPTAFSPEAAAPNNTFGPLGYGFEVHLFTVYNRYGQQVFESKTAGVLWDGTFDGKRLNSGTFFWHLDYTMEGETKKKIKGQVNLLH